MPSCRMRWGVRADSGTLYEMEEDFFEELCRSQGRQPL